MNTLGSIGGLSNLANQTFVPRIVPGPGAIRPSELHDLTRTAVANPTAPGQSGSASEGSFSGLLGKMVSEVNAKQAAAGQAVADLQAGKPVTVHQAMISMEEASISFQLMAEVRNRLLESYQELMRMQV